MILLLVVTGAWLMACLAMLGVAAAEARAGKAAVNAIREHSLATLTVGEDSTAAADLRAAGDRFARAASLSRSPMLAPIRVIPLVGWQVTSLHQMSDGSRIATNAGASAIADVRTTIKRYDLSAGPQRVALLNSLSATAKRLSERLHAIDLGRAAGLMWPLGAEHNKAASELSEIQKSASDAAAGSAALAKLLAGPDRYLMLTANNAEMRSGMGAPLRAGILSTNGGRLGVSPTVETSALHLAGDGVAIDPQLAKLWGWAHPGREWRNLGMSPRFASTGALAAKMWTARTGQVVDGVISVDAQALADILSVTGPVAAAGQQITSSNVVPLLTHDQYTREYGQRIAQLGNVMHATFAALDNGRWSPLDLAKAVGKAAAGRHLLVWSAEPTLQALWHDAGADGDLGDAPLLLSVVNRGGNKLDRFLDVSSTVTTRRVGAGTVVDVDVTMHNRVPTGEPTYIAGPHPGSGVGEGVYLGVATLNVPSNVASLSLRGTKAAISGIDGASRVMGGVVKVARGQTLSLRFEFTLPADVHALHVVPSARIPGARWTMAHVRFSDTSKHTIELP